MVLTRRYFLTSLGILAASIVLTSQSISGPDVKSEGTMGNNTVKTGYVYDPIFLKHTQPGHPEGAQRLEAILRELESSGLLALLQQIPSRAATFEELSYVHPDSHINMVKAISERGGGHLDPDTYTTPDTYDAATIAAGSFIDLTLAVIDGELVLSLQVDK